MDYSFQPLQLHSPYPKEQACPASSYTFRPLCCPVSGHILLPRKSADIAPAYISTVTIKKCQTGTTHPSEIALREKVSGQKADIVFTPAGSAVV